MGTAETNFVEFDQTFRKLLPAPQHELHPELGLGPGVAHDGFDRELAEAVDAANFQDSTEFTAAEFSNGQAVWLEWMNLPATGAPIGSSPDFASGAIIPSSVFPLLARGGLFRNGEPFDSVSLDVPALDKVQPPFDVTGHSHFADFHATNMNFAPPGVEAPGSYEWRINLRDNAGNGWDITVAFEVR